MSYKRSRADFDADNIGSRQHAPYVKYGTPLPAYDANARDDGSYVPVWKQEVTDERGRKRLHGAFTGGFSAGYFNTVGSKEGWTPSTFVSSRTNRAKDQKDTQKKSTVEDYMDEEDLAEQAESQSLGVHNDFAGLGASDSTGVRGMFSDIFRTSGDTMGVKLLQKMGWRQGQGIGPKVKRRADGDMEGPEHLFAPENSKVVTFENKTDHKGLGFGSELRLGVSGATEDLSEVMDQDRDARILATRRSKISKPQKERKTGFGVGVLNDTGSDDEDPYSVGPQFTYNRVIAPEKRKKKGGLMASNVNQSMPKPIFSSKRLTDSVISSRGFRKCHDGRLPLDGFVLSSTPLTVTDFDAHPPPEVPVGWIPARIRETAQKDPLSSQKPPNTAKAERLDAKARAAILGEQPLPGKSVFDFISTTTRERLVAASGNTALPRALGEGAPAGHETSEADRQRTLWDLVPPLDKSTAEAALRRGVGGWMPYAEDENKRSRYQYFLELRSGLQSRLPERIVGSSVDDWSKELREFAQAAEVFKPVSGLMAARFTSATSTPKLASDAMESSAPASLKGDDPAEKAAKMGLYGPLTRSTIRFFPTRLLCKRFGVKAPPMEPGEGQPDEVGPISAEKTRDIVSQASIDEMLRDANLNRPKPMSSEQSADVELSTALRNPTREKVDPERNDALEGQRAGEAVFKAIFGSDDEDD